MALAMVLLMVGVGVLVERMYLHPYLKAPPHRPYII